VAPRLPWRDGAARIWLQRLLADLPAPPAGAFEHGSEADGQCADADLETELSDLSGWWRRSLSAATEPSPVAAPLADAAGCAMFALADHALAPWRHLAEPAPGAAPATLAMAGVARRLLALAVGAGSGPDVQRCAVESGLLTELAAAPLRVRLAEIETRQGVWPQPLLAAHTRALRTDLLQAGTATEVELLSTHADACLDIEADWQSLFFAAQLAPLGAALNFAISPSEAARGLRGASAISRHLLGQTAASTLQGVLVQKIVQQHRVSGSPEQGGDAVAWRGEAGHGLLPLLRAWSAVAASRGARVPQDLAGLLATLQHTAGLGLDPAPATAPVVVQLWGVRADAGHAEQLLASPCRPAVPLWQGRSVTGGAV
jgi:hypothetical protein